MNKQRFIQIFYSVALNKVTKEDIVYLYTCYCKEFNKPEFLIEAFIQYLLAFSLINDTIQYPINHYKTKFNICTITNKEGNVISIF